MRDQWVQLNILPDLWSYKGVLVMRESDIENKVCLSASNKKGHVKAYGENLEEAKKNIEPEIEDKLL